MACSSHQWRDAKALRCCQTNGLADIACSFMMTAITPVNIAYAFHFCRGPRRGFRIAAVCAQADANVDSSAA
jgi:hypothetical protein